MREASTVSSTPREPFLMPRPRSFLRNMTRSPDANARCPRSTWIATSSPNVPASRSLLPVTFRHDVGRAVKPLLDRHHLAAGQPLVTPSVPAQPDQLRRPLDGAHDGIELLQAIGMPVRELGEVPAREGRL